MLTVCFGFGVLCLLEVDYSVKDRAQPQATDQVLPQIVHNSGLTFGSKAADDVDIEM